jgi:hypothetical protein
MLVGLLIAVIVLGIVVILTLGAVTELYRQLRELTGGSHGAPPVSEVGVGSLAGLPLDEEGLWPRSVGSRPEWLLILSDRCGTCLDIGRYFGRSVPQGLAILIAGTRGEPEEFLDQTGLRSKASVSVDLGGVACQRLGLNFMPVAARISEESAIEAAYAVGAAAQVVALMANQIDVSEIKKSKWSLGHNPEAASVI